MPPDAIVEGGLGISAELAPAKIELRRSMRHKQPSPRASRQTESTELRRDFKPHGHKRKRPGGDVSSAVVPGKGNDANEAGTNRGRSRFRHASYQISARVDDGPCFEEVTVNLDGITASQVQGAQGNAKELRDVLKPIAGELYLGCWQSHWYAVLVLPTDGSTIPGIPLSIFETSLMRRYLPTCYKYAEDRQSIYGWAKDYEDGGPHVHKRRFPVLYIDDDDDLEPGADFVLPSSQSLAWLPVGRLRPFSEYGPKGLSVRGYTTALDFYRKLEAVRVSKTPEKNVSQNFREEDRGT